MYASAMTSGVDASIRPRVVPVNANDTSGKLDIHLEGLNRYYLVNVHAPTGFLLTSGVCNNNVQGWECDYDWITIEGRRDRDRDRDRRTMLWLGGDGGANSKDRLELGEEAAVEDRCCVQDRGRNRPAGIVLQVNDCVIIYYILLFAI